MLTTFYPPYNFGGDGIGIQRLVHGLARRGHRVCVVHDADAYRALAGGDPPPGSPEPPGVDVVTLESRLGRVSPLLVQQLGRPVAHARRLTRLLARGAFDVINFHNVSLIGGPGLLAYGEAVKLYMAHEHWLVCPSHVLWRHGRERCTGRQCLRCVLSYRRPPQLWRYTGALRRAARHVDAFIAMSEFSARKHAEFGFEAPMEVLPYFLPESQSTATATDVPHPRPYFLFVGRLERIKGLDDVLPAFRDGRIDADLLVCGDGDWRGRLEVIARGSERIRFLGRVEPDRLDRYYRHARALIVPSLCFETFGIILIEAFRQGVPVIARRLGPFPEIVDAAGAGILFETEDELVEAARRLTAESGLRDRLGSAGTRAWREQWSEEVVVPRYLEIAARAADRKGAGDVARRLRESAGSPANGGVGT